MHEDPKFLLFDAVTRGAWSQQPVTTAFLHYLAFAADQANYTCAQLLRQGDKNKAMSVAGEAAAYERLIAVIAAPDAPKPEREEDFVDPGYRFHPELAPQEETADAGTE